jgi:hypothetical protein
MINLYQFGNPPESLIQNANYTIGILNEIFDAFPGQFKFNSGYRNAARNAAVGGVEGGYHPKALAADIGAINGNYAQLKGGVISILQKYGYELVDESRTRNHFHIEPAHGWNGIASGPTTSYLGIGIIAVLVIFLLND